MRTHGLIANVHGVVGNSQDIDNKHLFAYILSAKLPSVSARDGACEKRQKTGLGAASTFLHEQSFRTTCDADGDQVISLLTFLACTGVCKPAQDRCSVIKAGDQSVGHCRYKM